MWQGPQPDHSTLYRPYAVMPTTHRRAECLHSQEGAGLQLAPSTQPQRALWHIFNSVCAPPTSRGQRRIGHRF